MIPHCLTAPCLQNRPARRGDRPGPFEVWYCNLRDPLPRIAVPLRPPFADVPLDLQAALAAAYAAARYDDQLDYRGVPPPPPLPPADQAWVAEWRQRRDAAPDV